jgi:hypothetical protein
MDDKFGFLNRVNEMHQQIYLGFIVIFGMIVIGGKFMIWLIIFIIFGVKDLSVKLFQKTKYFLTYAWVYIKVIYNKIIRKTNRLIKRIKKKMRRNKTSGKT